MSQDPHYQREKEKYENPVASREYLIELLGAAGKTLSLMEICRLANASSEDQCTGIHRRLRAMERAGQVAFTREKKYQLQAQDQFIRGKVIGHRDGFGFLHIGGDQEDLFLAPAQMQSLLHDDEVEGLVKGVNKKGKPEARITAILRPRQAPIVGRVFMEQGVAIVIPDDARIRHEIIIAPQHIAGARQGNVVVVEILSRPDRETHATGRVIEVLGEHMAPGMEIDMALRTYDIPHVWPAAVKTQVAKLDDEVPESAKQTRRDLRALPLVTIDGEDARDFDDAVYCQAEGDGWRLWVAIADVSSYVLPGSPLDQEAIKRGNSVYFPEQVVPMLPEKLSNGLCSLNPDVDRLCMVCEVSINARGELGEFEFYEATMRSKCRFTYTKVAAILDGDAELNTRYAEFVGDIHTLYQLYLALKKARTGRGAIEFESQENQFIFNAQRKIETIVPVVRNDAHKLIEECMISANVCAARLIEKHQAHALFRIHEKPDGERLTSFTAYLNEVGISHGLAEGASPNQYTQVLNKIKDRPDAELIQTMLLRSMKQAVYSPDNVGHFGLSLAEYAHFTSPIRRYPDLIVHRTIKAILSTQGAQVVGAKKYQHDEMHDLGEQCSLTERRADEATRDVADWLKCEFMRDHVGEEFAAVVASVTHFGLFVRITDFGIDGLVHITALGHDYFVYDEVKIALIGEMSGIVYRLGDQLTVQVAAVNLDERKIDLTLSKSAHDLPLMPKKTRAKKKSKRDTPAEYDKGTRRTNRSSRDKKKLKQSKRKSKR